MIRTSPNCQSCYGKTAIPGLENRTGAVSSFFWAHFLRLRRKKPGYPGLRFAPAPARCAGSAPHPSYPLRGRKNGIHAVFSPFGVCAPHKLQEIETADILPAIHADFRLAELLRSAQQLHHWKQPASLPAWLGGVRGALPHELRQKQKAQPFGPASLPDTAFAPCGFAAGNFTGKPAAAVRQRKISARLKAAPSFFHNAALFRNFSFRTTTA
jgi:hypothetical protein